MQGALGLEPCRLGIIDDVLGDALHQRVREPLVHRELAPGQILDAFLRPALDVLGKGHQPLGRAVLIRTFGAPVQQHVFDALPELRVEGLVYAELASVDDAHVHPGLDGVIKEGGMDRLAYRVVAAERKAHVRHAAGDVSMRQVLADPARRLDEVDGVVGVFLDAGRHCEDIRVEDDVLGREADFFREQPVGALADLGLARIGVGLADFVEGHHDHRRAVASAQPGAFDEFGLALLH